MPFLRRRQRKILGVLFVLGTTLFVYWTLKSRAGLDLRVNGGIPLENVDSSRSILTRGSDIKFNSRDYSRTEAREDGLKEILYSSKPVKGKELVFLPKTKADVTDESLSIGLQQKLQEIEKKILGNKLPTEQPKVMFVNSLHAKQEIVSLYKKTFKDLGYKVILVNDVTELSSVGKTTWRGLFCFRRVYSANPFAQTECPVSFYDHVQHFTQVSQIQGMEKLLLRNDGFCYMMSASRHLSALKSKPLSPPCFVLPAQFKLLAAENKQEMSQWTIKTLGSDITHADKWGYALRTSEKEISANSGDVVVQQLPGNALLVDDQPVVVLVYVLITSVSPLRLYRHSEGQMEFLVQNESEKNHWSLGMFIKHLENKHGKLRAKVAIQQMDELIVNLFLVSEPSLQTYVEALQIRQPAVREQQSFQLLQISLMFNSSFYPYILEVKDPKDEGVPQITVQDTVNMVFSLSVKTNISQEVHEALNVLRIPSPVKKTGCQSVMGKCITDPFLHYLLQMRWEASHLGNFKKLYPSPRGDKFNELISRLSSEGTTVEDHFALKCDQCTPELHHILTAYEVQCQMNDTAVDLLKDGSDGSNPITNSASDVHASEGVYHGGERGTGCENDEDPVLLELHTQPAVILNPPFIPDVFVYQATVPFDTMLLKVWGKASTCKSDVRINSKSLKSQFSNHSLGVGWNKFTVYVMDTGQSPAAVEYKYTLDVFRQRRSENEARFAKDSRHEVCAQLQDCDLEVFPGKPCGLNKLPHVSWETFLLGQQQLGLCGTGHKPGRWVLPCRSCDDPKSCYWKVAVWAPYACQYNMLSREQVRTCLADKKILFVGDSTNRGIMYYLMEKLNGSLRKWEKTHAMKIYTDELNGSRTSVSFAYYPQFWLSNSMRPVFVKTVYQLIARFLPLENSTNTILVIGGVQWMGQHHITETRKALTSLGLNGIKVVVKSLGAGFHLSIPGLLRQDLAGQRKTAQRNRQVIEAAEKLGYDVVDTFSITVSRYKEFLQGKCSCHFHKVVDMESLMRETDEIPSPLLDKDERHTNSRSRYHVIGPINSVYSELVINRMCS